ncbi:MAG: ABC transporter substrate-binding protein [Thermoanaerobaculales bacterium]|nr:ABC transporter substrate-binding protein [Thermoanaerobaculales bacterium]
MHARLTRVCLVLILAVVPLLGCGSSPVLGILLPTSGDAAPYGESMKKAVDLALENATADGTMPANLTVVWGDSATDAEQGRREIKRLADQGAKLIIAGTTSGTARAFLPQLEDSDVIVLSPSASAPALTKDSRRFFRLFASDELEGQRAGRFLYEDQNKQSVLIFSEDSEQARGIEPPFRQVYEGAMGGTVVGRVLVDSPDWHTDCADLIAAHQPESIYIIAYADKTIEVLRHLRTKGYSGTICATSAFHSGYILEEEPELVDGLLFPQPAFEIESELEPIKSFVAAFRTKYGHDPDIYAAHAYDAVRVALQIPGIVRAWEATEVRRALQFEIKEFPGVTGPIQFDDYGNVRHNPVMFIVKDGAVMSYKSYLEIEKKKIREKIRKLLQGQQQGG